MLHQRRNNHNGQSKDENVIETAAYAPSSSNVSYNVLTNDGQVMAGAVRVPLQKRVVDSVGKIGMMVSLNQYHWSNYPLSIFSIGK